MCARNCKGPLSFFWYIRCTHQRRAVHRRRSQSAQLTTSRQPAGCCRCCPPQAGYCMCSPATMGLVGLEPLSACGRKISLICRVQAVTGELVHAQEDECWHCSEECAGAFCAAAPFEAVAGVAGAFPLAAPGVDRTRPAFGHGRARSNHPMAGLGYDAAGLLQHSTAGFRALAASRDTTSISPAPFGAGPPAGHSSKGSQRLARTPLVRDGGLLAAQPTLCPGPRSPAFRQTNGGAPGQASSRRATTEWRSWRAVPWPHGLRRWACGLLTWSVYRERALREVPAKGARLGGRRSGAVVGWPATRHQTCKHPTQQPDGRVPPRGVQRRLWMRTIQGTPTLGNCLLLASACLVLTFGHVSTLPQSRLRSRQRRVGAMAPPLPAAQ